MKIEYYPYFFAIFVARMTKTHINMKKDIILTTTASIPNFEIIENCGLVFANVVLGTNFFSDFAASITDTFGGTSDSYQGKLDKIYSEVVEKLKKKTLELGCNAIIGFKIDFDEISGKQKSMFMVNAVGTACKAKAINNDKHTNNADYLDNEEMENAVQKFKIIKSIKDKKEAWIPNEAIEYLFDHPTNEIVDELLDYYYVVKQKLGGGYSVGGAYVADETPTRIHSNIRFINQYIGLVLNDDVISKVYSKFMENETYYEIIEKNSIFDSKQVLRIAEQDPIKALKLLGMSKQQYSKEDVNYFKQIVSKYDNLPNRGSISMSKGGMFSKSQEQYICEDGHVNDGGVEFCKECGKNIQGLTKEDLQNIEDMKLKIDVLEKHFG